MKVYYAHSMKIYGTKREANELKYLKAKYKDIINPHTDIVPGYGMLRYLNAVDECSIVVCSEYKGHIGKGVYEEVRRALEKGIKVVCLRKKLGIFRLVNIKGIEVSNHCDWFVEYGKLQLKCI